MKVTRMHSKFVALFVMCAFCVDVSAQTVQPTFTLSAYQERLSSFIDGNLLEDEQAWVRHADSEPKALARSGVDVVVSPDSWNGWSVEGFVESQAWSNGSDKSVAALGFANNQKVATKDATYAFSADFQKFRRWGTAVSKQWRLEEGLSRSRAWVRVKGFAVDQFKFARTNGTLTESATGNVGLYASVEQNDLGKATQFVSPKKSLGVGFGLDFGGEWWINRDWMVRAEVKDAGPTVRLKHVLRNSTQYNTSNATRDANGYISYSPMVVGQYSDVDAQVKIHPSVELSTRWEQTGQLYWLGGVRYQYPFTQVFAGVELSGESSKTAGLLYAGSGGLPNSVGLQWRYKGVRLGWRGDALQPGKARVWMLTGELSF